MNEKRTEVIEFHDVKANRLENKNSGDGGGGNMDNYITRKEFEQYEKRMDENFKSINDNIEKLPERIDEKIDTRIEKMKNSQIRWFIITIIAILGIAGRIFGLY